MNSSQELRSRLVLGTAVVFAMAWAITRAAVQSITIDEAVTYNTFVFSGLYLWYAANNHVLNSVLMYGFTTVLGLSQFTARVPALIGAAFYIWAAYRLCRLLSTSVFVQLTLFVCLVFNPLIFDHLVAARGYGLALGFLMWVIVYSAEAHVRKDSLVAACAISSTCAGMSVDANFAFAFVNLAAMSAVLLCAWHQRPKEWLRLLAAAVLPGAVVVAIVSGYTLLNLHPGELIYGAKSLRETFASIIESSLFQTRFAFLKPVVFPLVGATGVLYLFSVLLRGSKAKIAPLGWAAAAIFVATVVMHWTAFRMFGVLLPKDRTAIFLFPLFMIVAGAMVAIPAPAPVGRYLRAAFVGSLACMAVYFLLCLRLTYFKEWFWDSDVQTTYAVLSCLNREHQVTHVVSTWEYRGPLNFYQLAQPTSIQDIDENFDPGQTQIYVVDMFHTSEVLQGKNLKIFYRSPTTDLVLAASPALAETYRAGNCVR